jgi:hypothetical protein
LHISIAGTHWRKLEDKTKSAFAGLLPAAFTLTGLGFGGAGAIVAFGTVAALPSAKDVIGAVVMGSSISIPLVVVGSVLLVAAQEEGESNREGRAHRRREREYARTLRRSHCPLNPR